LRYAGLAARLEKLGYEVHDSGNLKVPVRESLNHERQSNYLPSMRQICEEACAAGQQAVAILTNAQDFMVNLWNNLKE
jgi:arginase